MLESIFNYNRDVLMAEITPDTVLDVRGEACPYPFIRTKWLMEKIASGKVIKVVANDPDALENIDAWTKRSSDRILRIEKEGDTCIIYLKKKR